MLVGSEIFILTLNLFLGMGTSAERSTNNPDYYTMGNKVPGIKIDGMNVLAVREGMKFAKDW